MSNTKLGYALFSDAKTEMAEYGPYSGMNDHPIDNGAHAFCGLYSTLEDAIQAGNTLYKEEDFQWAHIAILYSDHYEIAAEWDTSWHTHREKLPDEDLTLETERERWGWVLSTGYFKEAGRHERSRTVGWKHVTSEVTKYQEVKTEWQDIIKPD